MKRPAKTAGPGMPTRSGTYSSGVRTGPSAYALQKIVIKKQEKQLKKQATEVKALCGQLLEREQ